MCRIVSLNGAQYFDATSSFHGERIDSCKLLPNPTRNHNSQGLRLLCIRLWELGLLQAGLVLATRSLDVSGAYNIAAALIFLRFYIESPCLGGAYQIQGGNRAIWERDLTLTLTLNSPALRRIIQCSGRMAHQMPKRILEHHLLIHPQAQALRCRLNIPSPRLSLFSERTR